jgi:protein-S-isoprenylcysteine O-methyltransferase Ste14
MWKSFVKTCLATACYAAVHSAFASLLAKQQTANRLGQRQRNALYRPFYLAQSVVTMLPLVIFIRRQPRRMIYDLRGVPAFGFRLAQLGGIAWAVYSAHEVGMAEILGLRGLTQWRRGDPAIAPEPEAQGPSLDRSGQLRTGGPFQLSRHPLNFAPLLILWLNPRLTTNLLAFNLVSAVYLVLGSRHEAVRLRAAYGKVYGDYQQSGIPFYWPGRRKIAP